MSHRENKILSQTENARQKLQHEASQYAGMAEPLTVIQYLLFRSFVQEAHIYALLDQVATGKIDTMEMQKRFADHMDRIADEMKMRRGPGVILGS